MQSNKNIPPEIKELIEKTARRGATLNIDHVSRAYIIVGGTLDKYNNSLSEIKIRSILNGRGFSKSEINRAERRLEDTGWIVPDEGKKWFTLSRIAWAYWKEIVDSIEDWEGFVDTIIEEAESVQWLAVSLRMVADQKKHEAKLATSDVDRKQLVSDAVELYREAAERYEETHGLPFARMPHSLLMDAHLTRGLLYSVQNITEVGAVKAIELLDSAIVEMVAALEFADGADVIRLKGAIASHKAKQCVREIDLHRDDAKKRDELLDRAIIYLGEASESFDSLGETGACSSKTCDGCRHLYTALGLIRDGYREESNRKIMDAVSEIRLAEECYQSISNELGMDVVGRVNEILRRVADNLKNVGGFDPGGAVDAANNVFDALDEIAGVGLRNMIKILVWDEAGNMTERKISDEVPTGGSSADAKEGGISAAFGTVKDSTIYTGPTTIVERDKEPPPEKPKSTSLGGSYLWIYRRHLF